MKGDNEVQIKLSMTQEDVKQLATFIIFFKVILYEQLELECRKPFGKDRALILTMIVCFDARLKASNHMFVSEK